MTSNSSTRNGGGSGGKLTSKLKGAAQVVHGIGESIRGTVLGVADAIAHTPSSEAKYETTATKGKAEIEEGVAKLRGHTSGGDSSTTKAAHSASEDAGTQGTEGGAGTSTVHTGDKDIVPDPSVRSGEPQLAPPATTVDVGEHQAGSKEGTKEKETTVSGAYKPSPPGRTQSFPEKGPQPQPAVESPRLKAEQGDTSSSTEAQLYMGDKPLPERPQGSPEKWEIADEKPERKESGQIFVGSQESSGVTGAEGAEGGSAQTQTSSEGKAGGQPDTGNPESTETEPRSI